MTGHSESVSLTIDLSLTIVIVLPAWIINGTLITILPRASCLSSCRRSSSISAHSSCHPWRNILVPIVSSYILSCRVQEFCGIQSSLFFRKCLRALRRSCLIWWLSWCRRFHLSLSSCLSSLLFNFLLLLSLLLKCRWRLWLENMLLVEHSMAELNLEYGLRKISFDSFLNYWQFQDLVEIRS